MPTSVRLVFILQILGRGCSLRQHHSSMACSSTRERCNLTLHSRMLCRQFRVLHIVHSSVRSRLRRCDTLLRDCGSERRCLRGCLHRRLCCSPVPGCFDEKGDVQDCPSTGVFELVIGHL